MSTKKRKKAKGKGRRRPKRRTPGVDDHGYLVIKAGPHRDVRVHTLVAEALLGRKLKKDEDVHHKDGNKLNCDWRNLEVKGHQDHGAVSAKQHFYMKENDIAQGKEWDDYFEGGAKRREKGDTSFP